MEKIDILQKLLQHPIGSDLYSRAVNLCRNKLTRASVPAWKKFILISVIVVFSQVNVSLSSPVSRSIWLSSQYAIASTVAEEDSEYILSTEPKDELLHYLLSKEDLTYQIYSPCYTFADADIFKVVSLRDAKIRPGLLPQEDRIAPHIFLRAPPIMVHGPPYRCTDNGIDLSRWPSYRSIKNSLAFLLVNSWLAEHLRRKKNKNGANIPSKKDDMRRLPISFQQKPRHLYLSYFFKEDKLFFSKKRREIK